MASNSWDAMLESMLLKLSSIAQLLIEGIKMVVLSGDVEIIVEIREEIREEILVGILIVEIDTMIAEMIDPIDNPPLPPSVKN